jgi:feruloyl-CoA synthase
VSRPATSAARAGAPAPYRFARLGPADIVVERRPDGTLYAQAPQPLGDVPTRLTDRLHYWAEAAPERVFMAERGSGGGWRSITYAQTLAKVRAIAQALLDRGLSAERPIAILSGNDIEHALLGLAALYAGVPYAPISPAYSLVSRDFAKLKDLVGLLTPGLVFAASGRQFAPAIAASLSDAAELVVVKDLPEGRAATEFASLLATTPTAALDRANAAVGPDTVAKFLFTSGSAGRPKGVVNTQRMLCSNLTMLNTCLAFMTDAPVIVDWLPWNHTFGGNHNVGLMLFNGGSLYIDDGRPTEEGIAATVRNLREIAPTVYFNVPKGYEFLLPHLRRDRALREVFYSRLNAGFFAAAAMPRHLIDAWDEVAVAHCGERIVMLTGLGATETAPFATWCTDKTTGAGRIGVPAPGQVLKLVPYEDKFEARVRGPNVTPGYWRQPELTKAAFDEEGFYKFGDAVQFVDPAEPQKGLSFAGRLAENFKLSSGTWVEVGLLRARMIAHFAPYVRDVVIAGLNRDAPAALIIPDMDAFRSYGPDAEENAARLFEDPRLVGELQRLLTSFAAASTGSSTRVERALVLYEPLSIDRGEVTDKGSINQRAVLEHRAALVELLYDDPPDPRVIVGGRKPAQR